MTRPLAKTVCALLAAGLLLGACGKKSNLSPPDGQEESYTYPRIYPSVPNQPSGRAAPPPRDLDPRQDPLSPFPDSRTSPTKTYGSS